MKKLYKIFAAAAMILLATGCGIYSFSGTSIAPDVKSITVHTIENKAMQVNPALSNQMTQSLQDKYRHLTKLDMVTDGGDLDVSGYITSYEVTPTAITSEEVASKNRLTVTVKIVFKNEKYPKENFDKSFAAYQDYDSTNSLDAVQAALCDQIVETLVEDIFNATVANW
jgi:outer membrane lipopolysaccharide assembly protein LptE/RlpB